MTENHERQNPRPVDIPDATKKDKPKVVLAPEVQAEREIRAYIRKDGVFRKDMHALFAVDSGLRRHDGSVVYTYALSTEEAEKVATEACSKSGRSIKKDPVSGRPMAVPGWNLEIRVPGFEDSEQAAPAEKLGVLRERLNNKMLLEMKEQNDRLQARLDELEQRDSPASDSTPPPREGRGRSKKESE